MVRTVSPTEIMGGLLLATTTVTTAYTVQEDDCYILVVTSSANYTITLPANPENGRTLFFSRTSTSRTVTLARNGQNINGGTSNYNMQTSIAYVTQATFISGYGWKITY